MAIRPDAPSNPIGVADAPIQSPSSGTPVGGGHTQAPTSGSTATSSHSQTSSIASADAPITPKVGASIITESPLDVVPKTNVPASSTTIILSGSDATNTKSTSTPIADAIKNVGAVLGGRGGGGGGGGASSEEGGATEEPKKPNYLVIGLMGLGIYYIFKKLL